MKFLKDLAVCKINTSQSSELQRKRFADAKRLQAEKNVTIHKEWEDGKLFYRLREAGGLLLRSSRTLSTLVDWGFANL